MGDAPNITDLTFLSGQKPKEQKIASLLYNHWERKDSKDSRTKTPHGYASEALKCSRQVVFRLLKPPIDSANKIDLAGMSSFKLGTFVHEQIQNILENADSFAGFQSEVYWSEGFISGYADGLYTSKADDEDVVLEIKTMRDYMFRKSLRSGEPDPGHKMQSLLSCWALGAARAHVVYFNKDARPGQQVVAEYFIDYKNSEGEVLAEVERMRNLVRASEDLRLPMPIHNGEVIDPTVLVTEKKRGFPCGYCAYYEICTEFGQDGEIQLTRLPNGSLARG